MNIVSKPIWSLNLFGRLQVQYGNVTLDHFAMRRVGALLGCVALRAPNPVPREEIIALLWPEESPTVTRNRLSVMLNSLRQHLSVSNAPAATLLSADRH